MAMQSSPVLNVTPSISTVLHESGSHPSVFGPLPDTFAFRKPDPRHLLETIRAADGDPARAVMVGDSRNDVDAAKAAGIPVIAVDFGYSDRPVRELEPSRVISHFDELTPDLVAMLIRKAAA